MSPNRTLGIIIDGADYCATDVLSVSEPRPNATGNGFDLDIKTHSRGAETIRIAGGILGSCQLALLQGFARAMWDDELTHE